MLIQPGARDSGSAETDKKERIMDKMGYFSGNDWQVPAITDWGSLTDCLVIFANVESGSDFAAQEARIMSHVDLAILSNTDLYILHFYTSVNDTGLAGGLYSTAGGASGNWAKINTAPVHFKAIEKYDSAAYYADWLGDSSGFLSDFTDPAAAVSAASDIDFIAFYVDTSGFVESVKLNDRATCEIPVLSTGIAVLEDEDGRIELSMIDILLDAFTDGTILNGTELNTAFLLSSSGGNAYADLESEIDSRDAGIHIMEANYTCPEGHPARSEEGFIVTKIVLQLPEHSALYPDDKLELEGPQAGWLTINASDGIDTVSNPYDPDNPVSSYMPVSASSLPLEIMLTITVESSFLGYLAESLDISYYYRLKPEVIFSDVSDDPLVKSDTSLPVQINYLQADENECVKFWLNGNDENKISLQNGVFGSFGTDFYDIDGGSYFFLYAGYYEDPEDDPENPVFTVSKRFRLMPPDFFLRDNQADTGSVPSAGRMWRSPDIAVLQETVDDPLAAFAGSELGSEVKNDQDNYIYLRINNNGGHHSSPVKISLYYSEPSSLLVPSGWNAVTDVPDITFGDGDDYKIIGPLTWNSGDIPGTGHFCFICELDHLADPAPSIAAITSAGSFADYVKNYNNTAWRNFNVVGIEKSTVNKKIELPLLVNAPGWMGDRFDFEIRKKGAFPMEMVMRAPEGILEQLDVQLNPHIKEKLNIRNKEILMPKVMLKGLKKSFSREAETFKELKIPAGKYFRFSNINVKKGWDGPAAIVLENGKSIKTGDTIEFRQYYGRQEVGRITWRFRVKR